MLVLHCTTQHEREAGARNIYIYPALWQTHSTPLMSARYSKLRSKLALGTVKSDGAREPEDARLLPRYADG